MHAPKYGTRRNSVTRPSSVHIQRHDIAGQFTGYPAPAPLGRPAIAAGWRIRTRPGRRPAARGHGSVPAQRFAAAHRRGPFPDQVSSRTSAAASGRASEQTEWRAGERCMQRSLKRIDKPSARDWRYARQAGTQPINRAALRIAPSSASTHSGLADSGQVKAVIACT